MKKTTNRAPATIRRGTPIPSTSAAASFTARTSAPIDALTVEAAVDLGFWTIAEFAKILRVDRRTVQREIADEILPCHEIRGIRRISHKDGLAYLRRVRRGVGHSQRRRSPRKHPKCEKPP